MNIVQIDEAQRVLSVRTLSEGKPITAELTYPISQVDADRIREDGRWFKGTEPRVPQWSYDPDTSTLTRLQDSRPSAEWSQTSVNSEVGSDPVTVQLTLTESVNGKNLVRFTGVAPMVLDFVNGTADVVIGTGVPMRARLHRTNDFLLTNELAITIADNVVRPDR